MLPFLPYNHLPIGDDAPGEVNAIVEIPRGSSNKYEYDAKMGLFNLDRPLYSPLFYPSQRRPHRPLRLSDGPLTAPETAC